MEYENVYWEEILVEDEIEKEKKEEKEEIKAKPKAAEPCVHEKSKLPGFDFTYIDKILSNMTTTKEKIVWLRNFKNQLQESQRVMAMSSWTLADSKALEDQYKSVTPYIQTVSLAIRMIQNKIKLLSDKLRHETLYPSKKH